MRTTVYACFGDCKLAGKAAAALLDHGLNHGDLSVVHGPTFGKVDGSGPLAKSVMGIGSGSGPDAAKTAVTRYLKTQGIDSELVARYEHTIQFGGAVLGATLPSGDVDESRAWTILDKYSGAHVRSYMNRPYAM